jgi:hypothetical protein
MAVTWSYNAGTKTATASGSGTTNFAALVAADVAGGWGKFSKDTTGTQILCQAKMVIGDGVNGTNFVDSLKQVVFTDGILGANSEFFIDVKANSTLTLGILSDVTTKRTKEGVSIFVFESTYYSFLIHPSSSAVQIYLYGCTFYSPFKAAWWQAIKAYNINCNGCAYPHISVYLSTTPQDYNNILVAGEGGDASGFGIRRPNTGTAINNLFILTPSTKVWFQVVSGVAKNVWFRGEGYTVRMETLDADEHCYIINADDDGVDWTINWASALSRLFRQYEFDLEVVDNQADGAPIEGAVVNVYDKDGNLLIGPVATDMNGRIPTQTLTRGYYDQAHGNILQDYAPLSLVITKEGYQRYKDEMNPTMKTQYQVSLNRQVPVWIGADGKLAVDLKPADPVSMVSIGL